MSLSSSSRNILSGLVRNYASAAKATATKEVAASAAAIKTVSTVEKKDWKAVELPAKTVEGLTSTNMPGASFLNDLRSTSGLGLGDGIKTHTGKWLQGSAKSPMEYIQEVKPIKVSGTVVASHGSDNPALGCPVEYINLKGTSLEKPAVCKYTGNRYYSDDWRYSH
ncbi:MAG: hypothetical protein WDW38_001598 [Sanguina aurantia]